jgi:hypothetical protein
MKPCYVCGKTPHMFSARGGHGDPDMERLECPDGHVKGPVFDTYFNPSLRDVMVADWERYECPVAWEVTGKPAAFIPDEYRAAMLATGRGRDVDLQPLFRKRPS